MVVGHAKHETCAVLSRRAPRFVGSEQERRGEATSAARLRVTFETEQVGTLSNDTRRRDEAVRGAGRKWQAFGSLAHSTVQATRMRPRMSSSSRKVEAR